MGKSIYWDVPGEREAVIPHAQVDAATVSAIVPEAIWTAPCDCVITAVYVTPESTQAGHATNYHSLALQNKDAAGTGTTEVATYDFVVAGAIAACVRTAMTLNTTAANLVIDEGDCLQFSHVKSGNGVDVEPGVFTIEFRPTTWMSPFVSAGMANAKA